MKILEIKFVFSKLKKIGLVSQCMYIHTSKYIENISGLQEQLERDIKKLVFSWGLCFLEFFFKNTNKIYKLTDIFKSPNHE